MEWHTTGSVKDPLVADSELLKVPDVAVRAPMLTDDAKVAAPEAASVSATVPDGANWTGIVAGEERIKE
jgi:hypothetical protein